MTSALIKCSRENIEMVTVTEGRWAGSTLGEIFESGGDTRMACGIHDIPASETIAENPLVDDILYILDGEIEISCDDLTETFVQGDFANLRAGVSRKFVVPQRVRVLYVTYPCMWK